MGFIAELKRRNVHRVSIAYLENNGAENNGAGYVFLGVPGVLLPLVIVTEMGGGILIALGLFTRYSALALAGFSILSAILFHGNIGDQTQQIMFMKNLAIAGGFLYLVANGAGTISLDRRLGRL